MEGIVVHQENAQAEECVAAKQDQHSFDKIYHMYRKSIYDYAYLLTQCSNHAQDITQEVFVCMWVERERLHQIDHIKAYMHSIARNRVIDHIRRSQKEQCIIKELSERPRNNRLTEEAVLKKEVRRIHAEAVNSMPPQRKLVYSLGKIHGWKRQEISEALGISPATVRAQMNKAIKHVKEYVKERG